MCDYYVLSTFYVRLKAFFSQYKVVINTEMQWIIKLYGMNRRERGFHARGVYPTQDTSRMGIIRERQEDESDTRIIVIDCNEMWKKGTWPL